ncbi:MAG: bile acid:sodium symporter [Bacteroidales bacterium]|jgi:sodium/bile acid cotransporter 7|nr:bile acid:sodium symporter [Bacteroidales bacterium]
MASQYRAWSRFLPDPFIVGILLMICLAWVLPQPGIATGLFSLSNVMYFAIMLLFFLYGLKLDLNKLKSDLANWRVHLIIQGITFVLFPLLTLPFFPLFRDTAYMPMWFAVFFLAVVPSTVSSSVVMVSIARGNVGSAIFNASISGLIGIIVTPLWTGLFMERHGDAAFAFGAVLLDLLIQILAPVIAGLLLNRWLGAWAKRNMHYISFYDKAVILLNVYGCFCRSFQSGVFAATDWFTLLALGSAVVALFFAVFEGVGAALKHTTFSREDRITILFCGSKKSLIHGVVFAGILFADVPYSGLILVPVMIYHAFQLFYISIVARRYGQRKT